MSTRIRAAFVGLLVVVLALTTLAVAAVSLGEDRLYPVTLTLFVGSAAIQRAGSTDAQVAHSGEGVGNGDTVITGDSSKAALRYPDGSITRLDSSTKVTVGISRALDGRAQVGLQQPAGLTWNRVQRLLGQASFQVSGPNNASAQVRGTGFGYYVEYDAAGNPVIWIDVYDGVVAVAGASGSPVNATAGQRVTVRAASAPTVPVPIPEGDKHLGFTVFNRAIEAVAGEPFAFATGVMSTGQPAQTFSVEADGKRDLQFVLAAPPGSTFGLTVTSPNGTVVFDSTSSTAPLVAFAPRAAAGTWHYTVRDLTSLPADPFWTIVGRS